LILGNQVASQFSETETSKYTFPLTQPTCDTLFLRVKGDSEYGYEHRKWGGHSHIKINRRSIFSTDSANVNFGFPQLNIVRGETDSFEVVIYGEANGSDRKEALHLARNIIYSITQSDSVLEFSPYFSVPKNEKWRAQNLHVEVRVPKGKMVYLHKNMKHILHDVDNDTDTWDGDMVNRRWIMGNDQLRCVDCDGLESSNSSRGDINIEDENSDETEDVNVHVSKNDIHISVSDPKAPKKPEAPKAPAPPAIKKDSIQ
jgi:hypothetical protein